MNKQEVVALIKEEVTEKNQDPDYEADFSKLEAAGFKIKEVEREGGEGQGEHYHAVLEVTKGDEKFHVKCDAYYASYDGVTWEYGSTYEVQPKEVTVTQWAKV